MRKFLAVALSAALVVPAPAFAANCRQAYVQQYAQPVYAQVVYDYNQIVVPKAFQVQVAAPFYMGVADDYRQASFAKQVAQEYAAIVELQRQQFNLGQLGPAPGQPSFTPKPVTKIAAILANRCAECHSPKGERPQSDLSGNPDNIPVLLRLMSLQQLTLGKMPKKRPAIPQDEFNAMGAWTEELPINPFVWPVPAPAVPAPIPPAKKEALPLPPAPLPPAPEALDKPKK